MIYIDNDTIKDLINDTIKEKGIKKRWIAEQLGITEMGLYSVMNKKHITMEDMKKIMNVIGLEIDIKLIDMNSQVNEIMKKVK